MSENEQEDKSQEILEDLGDEFMLSLRLKDQGKLDAAEDKLRHILRKEPRLPEPHMELARILLDTGRRTEAETHAREAVQWLNQGGQWTDELPENIVLSLAYALLAEVLRQRADEDDVIFGDPEVFKAMIAEARQCFEKARSLDPADEYASYHAFFLGVPGAEPKE